MAEESYERVLCVKSEVLVFKIPPRPSNRGYRAADWNLDKCDWSGRLRVVAIGSKLSIKLEDKSGELFAECPVDEYPSIAVEPVIDSSRYFVIRIKDPSGRSAFIGIGFNDRGDSFDLNVALQDHFKHIKQEAELEKNAKNSENQPKLDLSFKEGQTITINLGTKKSEARNRPKASTNPSATILPPPPGSMKIRPPPSQTVNGNSSFSVQSLPPDIQPSGELVQPALVPTQNLIQSNKVSEPISSNVDLLLDINFDQPLAASIQPDKSEQVGWADFTSYSEKVQSSDDWMSFE